MVGGWGSRISCKRRWIREWWTINAGAWPRLKIRGGDGRLFGSIGTSARGLSDNMARTSNGAELAWAFPKLSQVAVIASQ